MSGCGTDTVSYVSRMTIDRFQCIWVAIIGEIYKLIVEYLGNGSDKNLANYIEIRCLIKALSVVPNDHINRE